jgi:hypothetical protein
VSFDDIDVAIARWGGRPAGYVLIRFCGLTPLGEGAVVDVQHLFVLTEFRRHGVARALLAAVAGAAERRGADQIVASVPPSAREAHRYLARLGFSPMVVRRVAPTAGLRRRLAGQARRGGFEDLVSRRRSLRARAAWTARWTDSVATGEAVPVGRVGGAAAGKPVADESPAGRLPAGEPPDGGGTEDGLAAACVPTDEACPIPTPTPGDTLELPLLGEPAPALPSHSSHPA